MAVMERLFGYFGGINNMSDLFGGSHGSGLLFKWNGVDAWESVADQLNSQTIYSLLAFNGKIYAGTFHTSDGGHLQEWNGEDAWVQVAPELDNQNTVLDICEHNGKLYGGGSYGPGGGFLLEWNGVDAWVKKAGTLNGQDWIYSLCSFNGKLYAGTGMTGRLFEWNGTDSWVQKATQLNSQTIIYSLCVFNGKLYGGTAPDGRLFEWNGTNAWEQVAPQLNGQTYILSLFVFNDKLYGSTQDGGRLFEWNGVDAWVQVADYFNSQSRIYDICTFNEELYAGTYPSGKLFKWNEYVLKEYYRTGGDTNFGVDTTYWLTQVFTTIDAYDIKSVKLRVSKSSPDPTGSIVVSIREVDGNHKPTGSDLCSVEISDFSIFQLNGAWVEFEFDSSASLDSETEYAIVMKGEGFLASGEINWYYNTSNGYSDGHMIYSQDEGATWSAPGTADAKFETFSDIGAWVEKAPQLNGQVIRKLVDYEELNLQMLAAADPSLQLLWGF